MRYEDSPHPVARMRNHLPPGEGFGQRKATRGEDRRVADKLWGLFEAYLAVGTNDFYDRRTIFPTPSK